MADENKDLPYMLAFRLDICQESTFYGDSLDGLITFSEILSLIDQHPDIPITWEWDEVYNTGLERVLYTYKWILADGYFQEYEKLEDDKNADCKACGRNFEIAYYLDKGDIKKANQLAKDIENRTLICGENDSNGAWHRLKFRYLEYYLKQQDLEQAKVIVEQISKNPLQDKKLTEFENWEYFVSTVGKYITTRMFRTF